MLLRFHRNKTDLRIVNKLKQTCTLSFLKLYLVKQNKRKNDFFKKRKKEDKIITEMYMNVCVCVYTKIFTQVSTMNAIFGNNLHITYICKQLICKLQVTSGHYE